MPGFGLLLATSAGAAVRVASLDLCADEYLLLLARPDQIASVSRLSRDPLDSPLWRAARGFPANRGGLETALAARPTLVLTMSGGGKATAQIARKIGLATLTLPYPATINDVASNMVRVAAAVGDERRARPWLARLERLRAGHSSSRDSVFVSGGGLTVPATSLSAQWMALAGLRQRSIPGGRLSLEELAVHPPAVLLISDYRQGQASRGGQWLTHPLVARTPSRKLVAEGRRWTCAGPLMLEEVERLRGLR